VQGRISRRGKAIRTDGILALRADPYTYTKLLVKLEVRDQVRDAGYELLFFLGGVGAGGNGLTLREMGEALLAGVGARFEREKLERIRKRGLVEGPEAGLGGVLRVTALGKAAFDGGRAVEEAWGRGWDGRWRLLAFDLPRHATQSRVRFWRWLRANYFGRLQGSVWVSPDPPSGLDEAMAAADLETSKVVLFSGEVTGGLGAGGIAAGGWDFDAINSGYIEYAGFADGAARQHDRKPPTAPRLRELLREDRRRWWAAVRRDPLLPESLHPEGYEGPRAWEARCHLLRRLRKHVGLGNPD